MTRALDWPTIATAEADWFEGETIELSGFATPVEPGDAHGYFLLLAEPLCCIGCWPRDPLAAVEVFAATPLPVTGAAVRLAGRWRRSGDAQDGWRYQLHDARPAAAAAIDPALSRRGLLAGGLALGLAACAPAPRPPVDLGITADLHSHAGHIIIPGDGAVRPFSPVAAPMRAGGMALVALAVVADSGTHHVENGRLRPFRDPAPGELYALSRRTFPRVHELAAAQGLAIVTDKATLAGASGATPSIIVAAEGADFLEGRIDRVDEAYGRYQLRHLQLTHYRPNELGDIQTEPPVHGGLTDFGGEVVRRCNALGIVVDVAHGTYDLVKRAAAVTTRPLVLSHTSLADSPPRFSRRITADHARAVAGTGGVIGIWPPVTIFPDMAALARGMADMVAVVGVDHVGLGSDMLGLLSPAAFANYDQLPALAAALSDVGFHRDEVAKLLGGNYVRVLRATLVA